MVKNEVFGDDEYCKHFIPLQHCSPVAQEWLVLKNEVFGQAEYAPALSLHAEARYESEPEASDEMV